MKQLDEEDLFKESPNFDGFAQDHLRINEPQVMTGLNIFEAELFGQNETEEDSFSKMFWKTNTRSSLSIKTVSQGTSQKKTRGHRWRKYQDRKLVGTILKLQKENKIYPELLLDSLKKNPTTNKYWNLIKSDIQIDRSVNFLQTRYRKLLRNQELNRHEKLFFAENYTKYTIEEFQILFSGKTKATLASLKAQQEKRDFEDLKADKIINMLPQKEAKTVEVLPTSSFVSSLIFKKDIAIDISQYSIQESSMSLEAMPPKALRKMKYITDQISGEIYSKLHALKASLKEDLAQEV
ncbi:unnamed protein product [Moneuplotes crassus]|uniref:Uncharacterized protein n=1 Tax=Euplotes crassus TaxID=5936 RepID=A0AAD1XAD5_EUPCR|nr:unnamed protein product [Moneuplotes crassus]